MIAPNSIVGGRYRVVKSLGGGGMKLVYLAEDLRLAARRCALAEMVDSFTSPDMQSQAVSAFQREADMLAQLNNEHIPRIFDRFSEANHHYLVMEYIDGPTLDDELRKNGGKLKPEQVIDIALQVLDTLDYLHNLAPPVIYRDLKPSNVMITRDGQAKLIDFGIARHFQPLSNATMIGTQGYAPPEQYRGKVETRSDLYALGATMHHALSGRDPASEAPFSFPSLRKLCPDLDPALSTIVDQSLAYDVVNRMPTAAEFKRRLLEARSSSSGVAAVAGKAAANNASAKPQMKLPLGASPASSTGQSPVQHAVNSAAPPSPQISPAAPTMLSVSNEVTCPKCFRKIPADSRFCSYCPTDLRLAAISSRVTANPDAETFILTPPQEKFDNRVSYPAHGTRRRLRQRYGRRQRLLIIAAIFLAAFLITRFFANRTTDSTEPGLPGDTGSAAPSSISPPSARSGISPEPAAPEMASPRVTALRAALDAQGYTSVQFRIEGDTVDLWGTVPSEFDRMAVQAIVFTTTRIISLQDHIRVQDEYGGP
jgi:serine/threonine protein kinase